MADRDICNNAYNTPLQEFVKSPSSNNDVSPIQSRTVTIQEKLKQAATNDVTPSRSRNDINADSSKTRINSANGESPKQDEFKKTGGVEKNVEVEKAVRKKTVDLYPYRMYNPFAMEWVNVVDELEWIHRNSYNEDKMVYKIPFDLGSGDLRLTSVNETRVVVQNAKNNIRKGTYICASIETIDENGRKRNRGGDFFTAGMTNVGLGKSTAGRVVDHGNGTYHVYFYAAWSGEATIDIALTFTREAITYIKDIMKRKEEVLGFAANYSDGKNTEETRCSLINEGVWTNRCEYINPNSLGKTVLGCKKLDRFRCDQITNIWAGVEGLNRAAIDEVRKVKFLFEGKYSTVKLKGTPIKLNIMDARVSPPQLPMCGPDLPIPLSDGYWENNTTFVPLVCQSKQWKPEEIDKCLADTEILGVGDSTLGPLAYEFIKSPEMWKKNFHFMTPRIAGPKVPIMETVFESDMINNITKAQCQSKTPIVLLNFCFHYALWSTRGYVERLVRVKLAVERLFQRCPNSKVLLKLAHARDNLYKAQNVHSNNWIFYDMNRIQRRIFGGTGVLFLDPWDLTNSAFQENTIHMGPTVRRQESFLALSYLCPEMAMVQ
uniref:NXPE family member 3-like n=1 Tax=Saccoglossus kowalevskii TaxID=10224 RepID=A0ABM0MCM6_SACKO|nr:PREDICTED: NXPE family member 3-like [Saccoglossus kowalevskii]